MKKLCLKQARLGLILGIAFNGCAMSSLSFAQTATSQPSFWDQFNNKLSIRVGATNIKPQGSSGSFSAPSLAGTTTDTLAASQLTGGINYRIDDKWSIDLPLGLPFKHTIEGSGAIAGVGKVAEVNALPITILGQYQFDKGALFAGVQPYLGAGLIYSKFWNAKTTATLTALTGGTVSNPTTMSVDAAFGAAVQAGIRIDINPRYFFDANVMKASLKTKASHSTGQTMDVPLNPVVISIAVGYRF